MRVLVVEDEPLIAFDLISEIEAERHEVVGQCRSANEAVRLAETLKPDVVVMDIGLIGDQSGLDAARKIQKDFGISSVFISATLDRVDPSEWKEIEPVALISKPYSDIALSEAIKKAAMSRAKAST